MLKRLAVPEAPAFLQRFFNLRVCVEHALTPEELDCFQEVPSRPDRRIDLETVLHARREVVAAVARRGVHGARAGLERDVIGQHAHRITGIEGMAEANVLELLTLHPRNRCAERPSSHFRDLSGERLGYDDRPAVHVVGRIIEFRMKCDRQVRRNGPRRCRPDQDGDLAAGKRWNTRDELVHARCPQRELDID